MKAYGIGRLTDNIVVRMTQNGKKVATFTLACRRDKDNTDFVSCVAWEKRAETLYAYTHKGSRIMVEGDVRTRNYDDPNAPGRKVYVTEILVDSITLCDSKPAETRQTPVPIPTPEVDPSNVLEFDEDSLPF